MDDSNQKLEISSKWGNSSILIKEPELLSIIALFIIDSFFLAIILIYKVEFNYLIGLFEVFFMVICLYLLYIYTFRKSYELNSNMMLEQSRQFARILEDKAEKKSQKE